MAYKTTSKPKTPGLPDDPWAPPTTKSKTAATEAMGGPTPINTTTLAKRYNANTDAGSVLGNDLEAAWWKMYNGGVNGTGIGRGGGKGGGKNNLNVEYNPSDLSVGYNPADLSVAYDPANFDVGLSDPGDISLSLADRSNEFMDFQGKTTDYISDLMTNAKNNAEKAYGQGTLNQMRGDNDLIVQGDIQKLSDQYGGNVNHPAFIKEKNALLNASRMYNARAFTDLKQKALSYGVQVGEMAKNYYDIYSTREEEQQKLVFTVEQYNVEKRVEQERMQLEADMFNSGTGLEQEKMGLQNDQFNASTRLTQEDMGLKNSQFNAGLGLEQEKMGLQNSQFNVGTQLSLRQMAQQAGQFSASMDLEKQLAALGAIGSNRRFEAGQTTQWETTELEARVADKVSMMNLDLENRKLAQAQKQAKQQQTSGIWAALIGGLGLAI